MIGGLLFLSLLGFCFGLECMEDERKCPPEPWAPEGYCIEAEWSWIDDETGEEKSCPNWCSANCDDDSEKWCWGGVDDNDCSLPSFCQPFNVPIWNTWPRSDDDILCENHCPEICGSNQQVCNGGVDDYGCPLPDFCIPLFQNANGTCGSQVNATNINFTFNFNFARSDWIANSTEGCPMHCPAQCGAFEQECVGGLDTNGCPMASFCAPLHYNNETMNSMYDGMPREDGTNGTVHCQLHCPKQCNWLNEQTCWGGLDPNGCPEPDYCMPFGYEKPDEDGTNFFCPNYCSPMCSMDELWCQSGEDENGCWGPEYCMPQTTFGPNGQECPAFCPLICSNGSTYVPEPDDANGCPTQGFCEYM